MSNEIKQGDKVRVSKDAPKIYLRGWAQVFQIREAEVIKVEDGNAVIETFELSIAIPCKYLVKVDAEAREPKFKVNDVVRTVFNETTHITSVLENGNYYLYGMGNEYPEDSLTLIRPYIEPTAPTIKAGDRVRSKGYGLEAVVLGIDGQFIAVRRDDGIKQEWNISMTELIEPTEQTEAHSDANEELQEEYMRFMKSMCEVHDAHIRQMETEFNEFRKAELDRVLHPEKYYAYEVTTDSVAMDWQRYEADLAKELAISYAKRGKSPLDAVAAAKEIAKRLKQK